MPFEKGKSGNPAGRPRGVPDRRALVRELMIPDAPQLISKAVELALSGDTVMLKACLDKLIPNARSVTTVDVQGIGWKPDSGDQILGKVGNGELSLEEAKTIMALLEVNARLHEHHEVIDRLAALEAVYEQN